MNSSKLTNEEIELLNQARMDIFSVEMRLRAFVLDKEAQNFAHTLHKIRRTLSLISNFYAINNIIEKKDI